MAVDHVLGRLVVDALIVAVLSVVVFYDVAEASPFYPFRRRVLERPVRWLGLGHSWRLFAPRPASHDQALRVEVVLADGAVVEWPVPDVTRPAGVRGLGRHRKHQEHLFREPGTVVRRALCDHVVRAVRGPSPASARPAEVRLYRRRTPILAPGAAAGDAESSEVCVYRQRVA